MFRHSDADVKKIKRVQFGIKKTPSSAVAVPPPPPPSAATPAALATTAAALTAATAPAFATMR